MRDSREKGAGMRDQDPPPRPPPPPFQTLNYVPLLFDRTHEREVKLELLTLSVCNVSLMATESSV